MVNIVIRTGIVSALIIFYTMEKKLRFLFTICKKNFFSLQIAKNMIENILQIVESFEYRVYTYFGVICENACHVGSHIL